MIGGLRAREELARRLGLIVITDRERAHPRTLIDVVGEALRAGAPAIQLRDKRHPPRHTFSLAQRLRADTRAAQALFFVNDRMDLALATQADGVHLGPTDLPVAAVRKIAPAGFLIGYSAREPEAAREAIAAGADYVGCGSVFSTQTKAGVGGAIGLNGLKAMVAAVDVPVVGIGGITANRALSVFRTGAVGCAMVSGIMEAANPGRTVKRVLEATGGKNCG